jgi:hypothetical protein
MSKTKSTEDREARQKAWLRLILTKTYGKYKGIEEDVEAAYERNKGLDY